MKVKVSPHHGGMPYVLPSDTKEFLAAKKAMETAFGKEVLPYRSGGSIPITAMFEQVLGAKSVLMGFGLDSDAIHSPNEHYGLFNFYKGIESIPLFFENYSKAWFGKFLTIKSPKLGFFFYSFECQVVKKFYMIFSQQSLKLTN